jgi:hypothetical protein
LDWTEGANIRIEYRWAGTDVDRIRGAAAATEAVKRIDVLFAIEREINGLMPQERLRVR